jgi:hypothetical protein
LIATLSSQFMECSRGEAWAKRKKAPQQDVRTEAGEARFAAGAKLEFNKEQELSEGDPDMPELSAYA